MDFTEFTIEILKSYISENPQLADIYTEQIESINVFTHEINGYGSYTEFSLKQGCTLFPKAHANGYAFNDNLIIMKNRDCQLGFILSIVDGKIDLLEIYPSNVDSWDGKVEPFDLSK